MAWQLLLHKMRDLNLASLRLLTVVCELRSLTRAAEQEHLTASAVSKRIAQLEQVVGAELLQRGRHGALPTPAGRALLEHARSILFTVSRIENDMQAFEQGARGHVHLVASASAIAQSLLDDVATFLKQPDNDYIQIDVEEKRSGDIVRALREGSASVGVCWDQADMAGLEHRTYRSDELCLVVPPEHPLAKRKSLRFVDSLAYQHVGLEPNSAVQLALQRAAARAGKQIKFRAIVSNFDAAFRVVAARLAISVVPSRVSLPYAKILDLRTIPLSDGWARRRFAVCFQQFETLQPSAQRLVDYLVEQGRTERSE